MPSYKLIYFNMKSRAEPIRMLFELAGVDYEDHRIKHEEWPKLKPTTPNGTLPVLEIDGQRLAQSHAIFRYLAREFNLAGSGNFEMAQCDAVMETIADMQKDLGPILMEKDQTKMAALKKQIFEDKIKPTMNKLETNFLVANGGDYFVGKSITAADIELFTVAEFLESFLQAGDPLKDCPKLTALRSKVGKLPQIAAWLKRRPATPL